MNWLYDAWTNFRAGMIALDDPAKAYRWRTDRNNYRTFTAGETKDADQNWRPRNRSGDAEVKAAFKWAVARCRDQYQNNPLISGAIERICANVVRGGIHPQFNFRTQDDKLDKLVNGKWKYAYLRWCRYCDATGHDDRAGLQKLGLRHLWNDRGYLIQRVYDNSLRGVLPLRLEYLECDMLDSRIDGRMENGNIARKGIEHNEYGAEVAYWILDQHPGDYLSLGSRMTSTRISAADMIHVWDRRRISQFSGIPWLVAVVMEAYRMNDFRHITQDAARLQGSIVAFLESAYPDLNGMLGTRPQLGGSTTPATAAATGASEPPREITSNTIQPVPPGTRVNMTTPTQPGDNFEPFTKDSQRHQSAGTGMSFEAYANNYTDSSYASARSGSLEERLSYGAQQRVIEVKENSKVMGWFMEACYLFKMSPVPMPGYAKDPLKYHEMAEGMFPGWSWVEPYKDAQAAALLIDMGIETHRSIASQRGNDWDMNIDTLIEETERKIELEEKRAELKALQEANNANQTTD